MPDDTAQPPLTSDARAAARVGWTTLPSRSAAEILARAAVESGHASCAQVDGPIASFYVWKGNLQRDTEWRVTLKFPVFRAAALETWLLANHPYETPQWIAVDAAQISPEYLRWMAS
ncbi:MAG: divalent-cation tolerance protein CutA [Puniceicoccales bacterium]|jgi:periplasmic divalent cation tolerance protein|nr:divalent-cation tolerance protein CutA [Puniceicoccales bacterium]